MPSDSLVTVANGLKSWASHVASQIPFYQRSVAHTLEHLEKAEVSMIGAFVKNPFVTVEC